jgi:hypothetical protein
MLATVFATVALLPGLLTPTVAEVKTQTPVPILLPDSIPSDIEPLFPSGGGSEKEYSIGLAAVEDCGGATACFVADFSAQRGGRPFGPRTATLANGRKGRFKPLTCGASCSPPSIAWKERGVTYTIQANVGDKRSERRILVRMANQAIRRGPR